MRYSFEFKVECVDKYRQGLWPVTPEGIKESNFHQTIRKWARIEDSLGIDALKHNNFNKECTAEEKLKFVSRVLAGESLKKVAYSAGIEHSLLSRWVTKYKTNGYNGLVEMKKGRPCKGNPMKKKRKLRDSRRKSSNHQGTPPKRISIKVFVKSNANGKIYLLF